MIYQNNSIAFDGTTVWEGDRKATALGDILVDEEQKYHLFKVPEALPNVHSSMPLFNILYKMAVQDHEDIIIDKKAYHFANCTRLGRPGAFKDATEIDSHIFWAGKNFNTFIYTRDTSYSSYLGTSFLFPDIVKEHLRYTRRMRRTLGLNVSSTHKIPLDNIEQNVLDFDESEFSKNFNTNSYTRRTDDVVWVLGYWECCKALGLKCDLQFMLEQFDYFDGTFYAPFYDPADGLYRGQASFIDIGGSGYPGLTNQQGILVKALSTNCLYARAFQIMALVCKELQLPDREQQFRERAENIRQAILKNFKDEQGIYRYFISPEGELSTRQEVLGISFLTLFDLLPQGEPPAFADYPKNDFGFPLFWPFYDNPYIYHNNSIWPFADMMLYLARWKAYRKEEDLLEAIGKFSRHALRGDFNEMLEYVNGRFHGCAGYIWSAAAFLAIVFRMIAGMETDDYGKIRFNPCLPAALGDLFVITNLRRQNTTFDLYLHGNGTQCRRMTVDGKDVPDFTLDLDGDTHEVHIYF